MTPEFRIYYVCTGNQARSPIAAAWTARALADLPVTVGSAGTMRRPPGTVLPETGATAFELGLDVTEHRSSHVSSHDLSGVDLAIGFEFNHVAAAVVEGKASPSRTFLIKELVRLAREFPPPQTDDPLERARMLISLADGFRRKNGEHVPDDYISDPAGRKLGAFREIVQEVVASCEEMTKLLFGR